MDTSKIIKALRLDADATEAQIIDRIADLHRAADKGDAEEKEIVARIEAGEHEQVAVGGDGELTVALLYPLQSGSEKIVELVVRRPKFKHLREMDKHTGDIAKSQALLAAVCNRSPRELNELDQEDLAVLNACLRFFSGRPRRTGAVS